jgi:hypothetical protein
MGILQGHVTNTPCYGPTLDLLSQKFITGKAGDQSLSISGLEYATNPLCHHSIWTGMLPAVLSLPSQEPTFVCLCVFDSSLYSIFNIQTWPHYIYCSTSNTVYILPLFPVSTLFLTKSSTRQLSLDYTTLVSYSFKAMTSTTHLRLTQ